MPNAIRRTCLAIITLAGCGSRAVVTRAEATSCEALRTSLEIGACYHDARQWDLARRAYREAAIDDAATISHRKQALRALHVIGQELAVPTLGACALLGPAEGCSRSYEACTVAWHRTGSCWGSRGLALQVFAAERASDIALDELDIEPRGPEQDDTALATSVASAPFFYSLPDHVTLLLSADTELVSGRDVCVESASDVPEESTACHVVIADACRGRIGLVCETRRGEEPTEQQADELWLHAVDPGT